MKGSHKGCSTETRIAPRLALAAALVGLLLRLSIERRAGQFGILLDCADQGHGDDLRVRVGTPFAGNGHDPRVGFGALLGQLLEMLPRAKKARVLLRHGMPLAGATGHAKAQQAACPQEVGRGRCVHIQVLPLDP